MAGGSKAVSLETAGLLLGFVGVVIFGITLPMTRLAVEVLDPLFVTTGRAALAGLVACVVLLATGKSFPVYRDRVSLMLAAICLCAGFPGFTGYAMQHVDASHGGVVLGIIPLATAVAGSLIGDQRPSRGFWVTAVLGAALVVGFSLQASGGAVSPGDLLLLGSVLSAAIGYSLAADVSTRLSGWEVISWIVVLDLPITLPVALWSSPADPLAISPLHWGAFVYLGLFSQYFGFFFWNAGLALGGVAKVSQVQLLQTFVTLAFAALINAESVGLSTWLVALAVATAATGCPPMAVAVAATRWWPATPG
jgi:drug/metabolite transporter (DMT)-like permease